MDDEQLLRYSRHILLPEIGIEGQQSLLDAHVLMIGAGGLGSPAALYLASAGVGTLTICDGDSVDLTNLQRQIVHRESAVGQTKVESARDTLLAINPRVNIHPVNERVEGARLAQLVAAADLDGDAAAEAALEGIFASLKDVEEETHPLDVEGREIRYRKPLPVERMFGFLDALSARGLRRAATLSHKS